MSFIASLFKKEVSEDKKIVAHIDPNTIIRTLSDDLELKNSGKNPTGSFVMKMNREPIHEETLQNPFTKTIPEKKTEEDHQNLPDAPASGNIIIKPLADPTQKIPNNSKENSIAHNVSKVLTQKPDAAHKKERIFSKNSSEKTLNEAAPIEYSSPLPKIAGAVSVIALAAGGAYFFFSNTSSSNRSEEPLAAEEMMNNPEMPSTPSSVTTSDQTPNIPNNQPLYFPIDTQTSSVESIRKALIDTAQKIASQNTGKNNTPVELFVTDQENNPIPFEIFAKISEINFSSAIQDSLGSDFSLFVFTGDTMPRLGISVAVKNETSLRAALVIEEPLLAQGKSLETLFLGDKPNRTQETFQNNTHENTATRFINIHPETKLSIDYSIMKQRLVISTSKAMHFSVLEMISREK